MALTLAFQINWVWDYYCDGSAISNEKKLRKLFFHELAWWRSSFSASLCFVFFVDVLYTYFHSFAKSRSLLLLLISTLLLFWRRDFYFLTRIMTVIKLTRTKHRIYMSFLFYRNFFQRPYIKIKDMMIHGV